MRDGRCCGRDWSNEFTNKDVMEIETAETDRTPQIKNTLRIDKSNCSWSWPEMNACCKTCMQKEMEGHGRGADINFKQTDASVNFFLLVFSIFSKFITDISPRPVIERTTYTRKIRRRPWPFPLRAWWPPSRSVSRLARPQSTTSAVRVWCPGVGSPPKRSPFDQSAPGLPPTHPVSSLRFCCTESGNL